MTTSNLIELFERDLNKLKTEITSYKNENKLWVIEESISNSAGNLCLHLIGNLNYFVGAVLGNSDYVREREKEFNDKNVPKEKLTRDIDNVIIIVKDTLEKLTSEDLSKIYPINLFQKEMTTENFLVALVAHLNYHLGQINYHRRLLDKS